MPCLLALTGIPGPPPSFLPLSGPLSLVWLFANLSTSFRSFATIQPAIGSKPAPYCKSGAVFPAIFFWIVQQVINWIWIKCRGQKQKKDSKDKSVSRPVKFKPSGFCDIFWCTAYWKHLAFRRHFKLLNNSTLLSKKYHKKLDMPSHLPCEMAFFFSFFSFKKWLFFYWQTGT